MRDVVFGGDANHVLFKLGAWEIHALFEESEWVEIFHHCKKWNYTEDKVTYAYEIPGDTECPMCHETQPEEIQALAALHNMDRPTREWGKSLAEILKADYAKIYHQEMKKTHIHGDGIND